MDVEGGVESQKTTQLELHQASDITSQRIHGTAEVQSQTG